jgi:hypothetical protein
MMNAHMHTSGNDLGVIDEKWFDQSFSNSDIQEKINIPSFVRKLN